MRKKLTAPKPGTALAWLAGHLATQGDIDNAKLLELAQSEERKDVTTRTKLRKMRHTLRTRYGIAPGRARGARPRARAGAPERPTVRELKHRQLRKLVFELGFDDAREIFDEFLAMHEQMNSGGE